MKQNNHSVSLAASKRKRRQIPLKYLSVEELEAFFAVIESKRDKALFRVMYHCGLRASETGILQLSDFRIAEGKIRITRKKGSAGGEYRLPDNALAALRTYVRYERPKAPGPLFVSRNGLGLSRIQVWRLAKGYGDRAGVPVHPHMFKHSCGAHLADRGEDLLDIQDHLGHRNVANTRKYVEVSNRRRDARAERLRGWK